MYAYSETTIIAVVEWRNARFPLMELNQVILSMMTEDKADELQIEVWVFVVVWLLTVPLLETTIQALNQIWPEESASLSRHRRLSNVTFICICTFVNRKC